ncbi:MAG: DUF4340 domain-containing protein [Pirellulaceae bacterium]|nr:DUF4340 domain-containing protein [Pirellulaceae bacterium]
MNEFIRTAAYVAIAGVLSVLAWAARPSLDSGSVRVSVDQPLFPGFTDPLAARDLEIVTYNQDQAEIRKFQVAQENGVWVIPSHSDYPADAEQQIRDSAGSLTNLKILGVASERAGDHVLYGVVEPTQEKLKAVGFKGGGTLVVLKDDKGNDLVRLIVGGEVADSSGKPLAGQRFVRKPNEEIVYTTKIDLAKLPTEFDKWIQKDLLDINTFDIADVNLHDYGVALQNRRFKKVPKMDATVSWNSEQSAWKLDDLVLHGEQGSVPAPLGEQEELNKQKLDDLKTALDDLKIVDVDRKPAGLGSSLRAGEDLLQNQEAFDALVEFGFAPTISPDGKVDILASSGELAVDMKDGVRYVLRFGKVRAGTGGEEGKDQDEVKLNRYLFVTAQLSPVTLGEPPVAPAEPAGPAPATTPPPAEKPVDAPKSGGGGADQAEETKPAETKKDETKPEETKKEEPAKDPIKAEPAKPETPAAEPPKKDPEAEAREKARVEYQRQLNEYNDKKKKAQARVAQLTSRFADWYYVVSEDAYKKLHLTRGDIVKEGAAARDEGFGVDAFRKLETDGLKPAIPATPSIP